MSNCKRIEIIVDGLDCAHCASKIENNINKIEEIDKANLNFINKTLSIELKDEKYKKEVLEKSKEIINKLEPQVKVIEKNKQQDLKDDKFFERNKIIPGVIGLVLLVIALYLKEEEYNAMFLYLASYLFIGGDVLLKALRNILKGQVFDENFLMTIATIGAFSIKQYPEAVAVMLFYKVGEMFQDYAVNSSRKSIANLMNIKPEFANLKINSEVKKVLPKEVKVGDFIIVKPGEKVPLDGIIIDGESFVDTSALTGESVERKVKKGSNILSGFINKNSLLTIKVTKTFENSQVSKILDLVQNASSKKSKTENFITKFAKYYTPIVVMIAVSLALVPPLVIKEAIFSDWLYRALIFLVISCPCALVISIPLGFFGGIGAASKNGILIKGSNYLEGLNNVNTVIFDKTGTLTKGVFNVNKVVTFNNFKEDEVIYTLAMGESFSNHPIANSILKYYGKDINKNNIKDYKEISGYGIEVIINDKKIFIGNSKLMKKENIDFPENKEFGTVVHVALDKLYAGYIVISDEIKEDGRNTIEGLKKFGIKNTVMLTGDNMTVAENVGKKLGIDKVYGELLPLDKVLKFEEILNEKEKNKNVLFVGDGINDAPVLARADVGVSMGGLGSDAAIEASDIVIMNDEPSKLLKALSIARSTKKIVLQNIVFALGVKLIVLILGALGVANMWEAVFADVGVALIAVLNSMRVIKS